MQLITNKESLALSYIRVFAVLLIVLCHYCQTYENKWAAIFNVGVQIFLALSGYLYGHKIITDWRQWYYRRFQKLYIPVFLFLTLTLPLFLLFHREVLSIPGIICNYLNIEGVPFVWGYIALVPGTRHLWFMTAIAFCYIVTPLLQLLRKRALWMIIIIGGMQILAYLFMKGEIAFMLSWFTLYIIGYMYSSIDKKCRIFIQMIIGILFIKLMTDITWSDLLIYFNPEGRLLHDLLGLFLLFLGGELLMLSSRLKMPKLIAIIDKYSFHIYIVHYFLLIGPFSMAHITDSLILNIIISFLVIVVSTIIFSFICTKFNSLLFGEIYENQLNRTV